jgi:parallel beta-helix repeat protein
MLDLKLKLHVISFFFIILTCIVSGCVEETPKEKDLKTVFVSIDGREDFINIQDAIDHVDIGGSVYIKNGIYSETLILNKSVSLIGEDNDKTVISCIIEDNPRANSIISIDADNCYIENLNITCKYFSSGVFGIYVNSDYNIITNNIINNYNYGIYLYTNTKNNIITRNKILNSKHGIDVYGSDENNITRNNVSLSSVYGLYVHGSNNNMLIGNYFSENKEAIRLTSANNNELHDNLIINNINGIELCCNSKNNIIFRNKFINSQDAHAIDKISNQWDNGSIGNYWDDYQEKHPEANSTNGIWDIPYEIPNNAIDRYPLVNQPTY